MNVTIDAHALKQALKRLQPGRRYKAMQESTVTATAGGTALVIIGSLDNSVSVEAAVHQAGSTQIPLAGAIKLLGTYKKGSAVVVHSEPDAVFFDKLRFSVR